MSHNNNHKKINKAEKSYELTPWSDTMHHPYQDYPLQPSQQLEQLKNINIRKPIKYRNPTVVQRDAPGSPKQQKNPLKVKDYVLPPLLTRRSNVKMKEMHKDYATLDANPKNYYYQKKKSKQRYKRPPSVFDEIGDKKVYEEYSFRKMREYNQININESQPLSYDQIAEFKLSGRRYSLVSSLSSEKYQYSSVPHYENDHSKGTIPAYKLLRENVKAEVLKKVLGQLKGRTIQN